MSLREVLLFALFVCTFQSYQVVLWIQNAIRNSLRLVLWLLKGSCEALSYLCFIIATSPTAHYIFDWVFHAVLVASRETGAVARTYLSKACRVCPMLLDTVLWTIRTFLELPERIMAYMLFRDCGNFGGSSSSGIIPGMRMQSAGHTTRGSRRRKNYTPTGEARARTRA